MRHLNVWQRFVVMGSVFGIPIAIAAYWMASSLDARGVPFVQQELRGIEYVHRVLPLVRSLQEHRDVAGGLAQLEESPQRLATVRAEVEEGLAAIDDADARMGAMLGTTERWTRLRGACVDLLAKSPSLPGEESDGRHSRLLGDLLAFVQEIAYASNLTLEADRQRMHLVNALVFETTELAELLARAQRLGGVATSWKARTPEMLRDLHRYSVLIEFVSVKADASMAALLEPNDAIRAQLESNATASSKATADAMARIVALASSAEGAVPSDYDRVLAGAMGGVAALQTRIAEVLGGLLEARMAALRLERMQILGLAGLGLLLVALIGSWFIRDVTMALQKTVGVALRVAAGDLTGISSPEPRRDEIGALDRAFAEMASSLKSTVEVAERIAAGDLTVPVVPRSERDALGIALSNMAVRLASLLADVQRSGLQVNTSVNEIASTTKQQQATATEVAATTSEIGATARQIFATSSELVRTMDEVSVAAEESASLAGRGQDGLTRMETSMRQVMEAGSSISARLSVLNEKAGNINQVVTTITKVADQTNLLSLNAAIEAEKAGEYGRGFSVVATEIRRLADQTAVATYDIEQMVKEIQSAVSAGVMGMDRFSEEVRRGMEAIQQVSGQLSEIIQQVQALAPRCEAVTEGMRAQATGAEQITQSLAQLSEAAQQTIQSLRLSNTAVDGLTQAANSMRGGVSRFKLVAA